MAKQTYKSFSFPNKNGIYLRRENVYTIFRRQSMAVNNKMKSFRLPFDVADLLAKIAKKKKTSQAKIISELVRKECLKSPK